MLPPLWGCSGGGSAGSAAPISGQTATAQGLARDLDAAVRFCAMRNEMVVIAIADHEGGVRAYEMKTVRDEPVALQVAGVVPDSASPRRSDQLSLTARVGRFGDADRERALVRDIRERLAELEGDPFGTRSHPEPD